MSIAVLFDCSADSLAQYDQLLELCPELVDQPARPYHVCMPSGTGFLVIDVWESPEAFARFGEVLGPALDQVNLHPTPDVRQIHRIIAREPASTTG
ncbi:MAG TPA: hypothetical protein VH589_28645 [Trebonia sp.]|jgi:hypothetical protein